MSSAKPYLIDLLMKKVDFKDLVRMMLSLNIILKYNTKSADYYCEYMVSTGTGTGWAHTKPAPSIELAAAYGVLAAVEDEDYINS